MFVQKFNEVREDIRTRKTFTLLSNTKSLKVRTDKIVIPEINSIQISQFKPQDKKLLVDLFCNDDTVQKISIDILNNMNNNNKDLSTVDMLSHLNTNLSDIPATIDEFGNVTRKIASYTGALGSQNQYISRQQYGNA